MGDKENTWFTWVFCFKGLIHLNKMSDSRKCDDKKAVIGIATLQSNHNAPIITIWLCSIVLNELCKENYEKPQRGVYFAEYYYLTIITGVEDYDGARLVLKSKGQIDPIGLRFCGFGTIEPLTTIENHPEPNRIKQKKIWMSPICQIGSNYLVSVDSL